MFFAFLLLSVLLTKFPHSSFSSFFEFFLESPRVEVSKVLPQGGPFRRRVGFIPCGIKFSMVKHVVADFLEHMAYPLLPSSSMRVLDLLCLFSIAMVRPNVLAKEPV